MKLIRRTPPGHIALVLGFVILITGCQEPAEEHATLTESRVITPRAGEGIRLAEAAGSVGDAREDSVELELKLRLPSFYVPSQVIDVNLDVDEIEEQIVVYKRREDAEDRIRVLIADYDLVRNSYVLSWNGETAANNLRTFAVYTNDITGDHDLEIVCFGMNNAGEQTLDIFRRTSAPTGLELYYENVLQLTSDASIEIDEHERSDAYSTGLTTGVSFPVVHYSQNRESDNILDLYRRVYYWRSDLGEYVEGEEEEIAGREIEADQLQELFAAEEPTFEDFLTGPWYRTVSDTDGQEIAFFDPSARSIVFYDGEIQESFHWANSYKTIYRAGPGLWVIADNESIATIRRQMSIAVTGLDSVVITVEGTGSWNGPYQRLTAGLQSGRARQIREDAPSVPELSGLYKNESGFEIFFSPPRFTMRESDTELHGGFTLYEAGGLILAMKIISENGLVREERTYAVDFSERREQDRIVRSLGLLPAKVTVRGVEPTATRLVRLEQIEVLED